MDYNERRQQVINERKAERKRKKIGQVNISSVKYTLAPPIIKFEKQCFGWHYRGNDISEIYDGEEIEIGDFREQNGKYYANATRKEKKKVLKYVYFARPKCWVKNPLFMLVELLSNIVSFFRRLAISLWYFPVAAIVIIAFLSKGKTGAGEGKFFGIIIAVYAILIIGSLVLAGLGYLLKKVFRLEEATDEILLENGYDIWASND